MAKIKYFKIPNYPEAFLKTDIGKECLFYSILPYLCESPSTCKKEKRSKFNKCKALCSQIKIDNIINYIYKNKYQRSSKNKFGKDTDKRNIRKQERLLLKQVIPLTVIREKEDSLDQYELALREEILFFQGLEKFKYKYSKRDIIHSLMERMPSFLKEFFVAAECKKAIKEEKAYSLIRASKIQFPNDKRADFLYDKKLMPLMPLVYALFYSLKDEKPIRFYVIRNYQERKTKRFIQFDRIKTSSVENLNDFITEGKMTDEGKQRYIPYKEEDGKTNKKDFFFKNKDVLIKNFDTVISDTIKLAKALRKYDKKTEKEQEEAASKAEQDTEKKTEEEKKSQEKVRKYFSFKKRFNLKKKEK